MIKIRIHPSRKSDFFFKKGEQLQKGEEGDGSKEIFHRES